MVETPERRAKPLSITDVARETGVSTATVSFVLIDREPAAAETAARGRGCPAPRLPAQPPCSSASQRRDPDRVEVGPPTVFIDTSKMV